MMTAMRKSIKSTLTIGITGYRYVYGWGTAFLSSGGERTTVARAILFHVLWSGMVVLAVIQSPVTDTREVIISWLGVMAFLSASIALMSMLKWGK